MTDSDLEVGHIGGEGGRERKRGGINTQTDRHTEKKKRTDGKSDVENEVVKNIRRDRHTYTCDKPIIMYQSNANSQRFITSLNRHQLR